MNQSQQCNTLMSMAATETKLELFISCRSLINMDSFSKSDPYVILYVMKNNIWQEQSRTETIMDNLNPNFTKSFLIDFYFEVQQHLKFVVFDYDSPNSSDLIGSCECTLGSIAGAKDQVLVMNIASEGRIGGKIILRANPVEMINDSIEFRLRGQGIKETRFLFWHSTCPFLRFYRCLKDNSQNILVHETEYINKERNPTWKPLKILAQKLCNGDYNMQIKIELWDYRSSGDHEYMGTTSTTVNQLLQHNITQLSFKDKNHANVGTLIIENFKLNRRPNFLDYIAGGLQLNVVLAIDFTASNQNAHHPTSLHYLDHYKPNQYQIAIQSVCEILLNYDHDKQIPVFGFGCKTRLPNLMSNTTLHCFPLNGNPMNPEVDGINGIMQTYQQALPNLQFDGPTFINPIIEQSLQIAQKCKDLASQAYFILLILTDGEIFDMQQTINSIVAASNLPISIIIVGVGDADFTNMRRLDNDDGNLRDDNNRPAKRDCVQFVPFNEFKNNYSLLAKNVLEELPDQIVDYMIMNGKLPAPKIAIDIQNYQMGQTLIQQGKQQICQYNKVPPNMPQGPPNVPQYQQQQQYPQFQSQNYPQSENPQQQYQY